MLLKISNSPVSKEVFYTPNDKSIGFIEQNEAGEWVFWPHLSGGYWSMSVIVDLGQILSDLNCV